MYVPPPPQPLLCLGACRVTHSATAVATARVLTQALSNTVTANETLVARLWESYMNLPEDQVILMFVFLHYLTLATVTHPGTHKLVDC